MTEYPRPNTGLAGLGVQLPADQREAMLDMLDKDGDGDIDYEEFVRWFKGGAGADDAADYAAQVQAA